MGFLSKLFSGAKQVTKHINGLGEFELFKSGKDKYWKIEHPVLNLPSNFDFGAIDGDDDIINSDASKCFIEVAKNPDSLLTLLTEDFYSKAREHFKDFSSEEINNEFYLKTLTTSGSKDYEFGLHSRTKDIFIEQFVRNGVITEVHLDEGCCEV